MNDDATNLDRMHDIVVPEPIPWWPPAPGWYVVFVAAFCLALFLVYRFWKGWRASAYRREAIRELQHTESVGQISELLRRTALAVFPRSNVAAQSGDDWPKWLAQTSLGPLPSNAFRLLARGAYDPDETNADIDELRKVAADWIEHHIVPEPNGKSTTESKKS